MSDEDTELLRLIAAGPTGPQHQPTRKEYPNGWQPRAEVDEVDGGIVVSMPRPFVDTTPASHGDLLADFKLKSEDWIVDRVRVSRWQTFSGEWLESKRLSLLPRKAAEASRVDLEELTKVIARWRSFPSVLTSSGPGSFFHPFGDTQVGKIDGGGTPATVNRVLGEINRGVSRYRLLSERNYGFEQVVLPQLGDCIEGVNSQGGALIKRTDLGLTEMVRVYRRLLWAMIRSYSTYAERILVPVAPGNHDQAIRLSNQDASTGHDSWAIEAASAVQDAVQENPDLRDRVRFLFPEHDRQTVTFDASGTTVGIAHGHQMRGGWAKWWNGQAGGRAAIGDADLLLAGHYHHLHIQDHGGGRLFIQIPALDGGSEWFRSQSGEDSRSRTVTFWTQAGSVYDLDPVL